MANPERGEVAVTLDGRPFTIKYGLGALAAMQEQILQETEQLYAPDAILAEATRGRVRFMRAVIWAGLQKFHAGLSLTDVEDLIDAANAEEIQGLFAKLGLGMAPDPADVQAMGRAPAGDRPPTGRRRRGTGAASTSTPAASA